MVCTNTGDKPPLDRADATSYIDITLASASIVNRIQGWTVLEEDISLSDHSCIMFELSGAKANRPERPRKQGFRYHPNDEKMLVETLKIRLENVQTPQELIDQTQLACEDALSDKIVGGRQPIHWWTPEVQELHRECTAARRLVLREKRGQGRVPPEHAEHYRQSRAALRQEIRLTKRRQWESLTLELNKNPWGTAYRVVCKKFAPPAKGLSL